jgi:hypothetical protein
VHARDAFVDTLQKPQQLTAILSTCSLSAFATFTLTRPTPSATLTDLDMAPTRKRKRLTGDVATHAVASPRLSSQQQKQHSAATLHQNRPKRNIRAMEKETLQGQHCTEEAESNASTTATRLLALLSSNTHRKATPEPIDPSTSAKLVHEHLAQQNENDQQLWLKGEHNQTLHRLLGQLGYWGGVPCPLCLTYEWHESVYDHELRGCRLREESASARKMLRFLCTVQQPARREDGQCASCGYSRRICRLPQDYGFELERDCPCVEAVKKGIAVLLTVHDGMLGKIVYPQLVIANAHQERADNRAWLEGEDDFWGIQVNRLLTVFHKLADGYDGLTGKTHVRAWRP